MLFSEASFYRDASFRLLRSDDPQYRALFHFFVGLYPYMGYIKAHTPTNLSM